MNPSIRLGDVLLRAGAITREQLDGVLEAQASEGGRLGQNLIAQGLITEVTLATAISRQLGLGLIDLDQTQVPPEVTRLLKLGVAERYGLVPIEVRDPKTLLVACFDPTNHDALHECRAATGLHIELCVATASSIDRAIRRGYYGENPAPPPAGADPRLNVTRASFESAVTPSAAPEVLARLSALEREVAELKRVVASLQGAAR